LGRVGKQISLLVLPVCLAAGAVAQTQNPIQISSFEHIVIVVQENRTPDNLFQGLCIKASSCSTTPTSAQYNIQTSNWLDGGVTGGVIQPLPVPLANAYDMTHGNTAWGYQCHMDTSTGACRMDGDYKVRCVGLCPTQPQFRYVDNSTGIVNPYLQMATQFGWANYMFQTNQGPSYPAHQFIFGGTSAPSATDDVQGIFASDNYYHGNLPGCVALAGTIVDLISPPGVTNGPIYPCFDHNTIPDILPANVSWRYYSPGPNSIWNAPNAINHICQPNLPTGGTCTGPMWTANVVNKPGAVLNDIAACALPSLSWVIPTGQNSDHANASNGSGPSWVASVVNSIGESKCTNPDGTTYWNSTAILITWDDWGGWYDHVPPPILAMPQGDYQLGFRVPLIFVSAYTTPGFIDNSPHDFGSMLRFVESNFKVTPGILGFADARATDSLSTFYNLKNTPLPFVPIVAPKSAQYFLNDKTPPTPPDND